MKFDDSGPRKAYNFDLDGVLTTGGLFWAGEPEPNHEVIEHLIRLYQAGNIIIVWTARQWKHAPETVGWLIKNSIPFHGIYMSKGGADVYIDDKAVRYELGKAMPQEPDDNGSPDSIYCQCHKGTPGLHNYLHLCAVCDKPTPAGLVDQEYYWFTTKSFVDDWCIGCWESDGDEPGGGWLSVPGDQTYLLSDIEKIRLSERPE